MIWSSGSALRGPSRPKNEADASIVPQTASFGNDDFPGLLIPRLPVSAARNRTGRRSNAIEPLHPMT
jgi:hypothetical protein